jgi:hypothetical protein
VDVRHGTLTEQAGRVSAERQGADADAAAGVAFLAAQQHGDAAVALQHQADIALTSFVRELSGMTMDG